MHSETCYPKIETKCSAFHWRQDVNRFLFGMQMKLITSVTRPFATHIHNNPNNLSYFRSIIAKKESISSALSRTLALFCSSVLLSRYRRTLKSIINMDTYLKTCFIGPTYLLFGAVV